MKKISTFDLGMIIAFVVVGCLGFAGYWYLSGQLQTAQGEVTAAKSDYDKLAVSQNIIVSSASQKNLQDNIDLIKAQLDPLIQNKLQPKDSKLFSIDRKDPVAWKHELDDEVARLTAAAKLHNVTIPPNFYFAFSRYLNTNPGDQQTAVLSKQLLAVEQIANILINAPVKRILDIRRTYEEDGRPSGGGGGGFNPGGGGNESDRLGGSSVDAAGGIYTAYPFQIDFDTNPEILRQVVDDLVQSPYIFVLRTITVQNAQVKSPLINDLDRIAAPPPSVVDSTPGEVAATTSSQPPQFLFGNATLHVRILVDLIEWKGVAPDTAPAINNSTPRDR
jgi:hypothetical protein